MANESATVRSTFEHDLTPKSDSKFALQYFKVHGMGIAIRMLLCLGNVDWHDQLQDNGPAWKETEKAKTPFGQLPILHETTADGKLTRSIPETSAIERYLSRKFGYFGADDWEEAQINVWVSILEETGNNWVYTIVMEEDAEKRAKNTKVWIEGIYSRMVGHIEKQLQKNDFCGHLVGNKLSHADVILAAWLDVWMSMDTAKVVNATVTPGIILLKRKIDSHPRYAAYRKTEAFEQFSQASQGYFGSLMDFDIKRLEEF